jgi:uncharacterized protein YutE (UPF0331/DUF86 family)
MVGQRKIEGILDRLREYMSKLELIAGFPPHDFYNDFMKIESAKHLLQVAIECCLDASNHIIASQGFRSPKSYADSFVVLHEEGVLPETLAANLKIAAKFRNRLVHMYWEVDNEAVYNVLQSDLDDFTQFTQSILEYLAKESQSKEDH